MNPKKYEQKMFLLKTHIMQVKSDKLLIANPKANSLVKFLQRTTFNQRDSWYTMLLKRALRMNCIYKKKKKNEIITC